MNKKSTFFYVIDKDYKIIYANDVIKKYFPEVEDGCCCHEVLNGYDSPCVDCPIGPNGKNGNVYFNQRTKNWIVSNSATIEIPNHGEGYLVMGSRIDESNKNMYYNLSNASAFDELVEINLEEGTCRNLYHTKDKYDLPNLGGVIKEAVIDSLDTLIHPDDGVRYLAFWNESDMLERILASSDNIISEEFRQKKVDGSWGWIRQRMTLSENSQRKVVFCFIKDIDDEKEREKKILKESISEFREDKLTGLLRKNVFFQEVDARCAKMDTQGYCMLAMDVEHFKLFNDWYGWKKGDAYLMDIAFRLKNIADERAGIAGYIGGDNFAVFMPYDAAYIDNVQADIHEYVEMIGDLAGFLPGMGIYLLDGEKLSANSMYDRATLALNSIRGNYNKRMAIYDETMLKEIGREMEIISAVQKGIEEKEFIVYMQPQVHVPTGKIVGAESLVRWNSKEKGVISPGYFVPTLEKNGFIANLDKYIWDAVCAWQKQWMEKGNTCLPVSVNVSRVDIYSFDVVAYFKGLIEKYQIPKKSVKLEITESAYAEDDGKIGKVAEELRVAGFSVYLDDFGTGYSSLNMLKNVYVDALKMDMRFLDMDEHNMKKGESILESVIHMARILKIPIIMEGVEEEHQIRYLTDMGCRYVQGFYYYRPMPVDEFESLLLSSNVDYDGLTAKQVEQLHIREFLDENLFTDTMLNNIVGPVAFYGMNDDRIQLLRVNEQFYKLMQIESVDIEQYREHIQSWENMEKMKEFVQILKNAYDNPVAGAEGICCGETLKGASIRLFIRAFFLRQTEEQKVFYVGFTDIGSSI